MTDDCDPGSNERSLPGMMRWAIPLATICHSMIDHAFAESPDAALATSAGTAVPSVGSASIHRCSADRSALTAAGSAGIATPHDSAEEP